MKTKRILSLVLVLVLTFGTIPFTVQTASAAQSGFVIENGVLTQYNGPGGDVVIPDSVTAIGREAFSKCAVVTSVTIPGNVTTIGAYSFRDCANLASVNILYGTTTIESSAFYNCSKLASVSLPNSLTYIGYSAFAKCTALASITIPDSVTSLGGATFSGCTSLTQVYGGNGVTTVEINSIFDGTPWPELVEGDFVILGTILVRYNGDSPDVVVPEGITKINIDAFADCGHVRSITLPSTIEGIAGICRAWVAPPPPFNTQHYMGTPVLPTSLVTLVFPTHGQLAEEIAELSLADFVQLFENFLSGTKGCTSIENFVNCPNQAVLDQMEGLHAYLTTWTNPGKYVSAQSERVTKLAQEITAGLTTDYEKAKALFWWVNKNMTYDDTGPKNLRNADKILDQMRGVCDDYSWLLMCLCRAVDIPAAQVIGYRVNRLHAWNMIFADGRWFWAEPTVSYASEAIREFEFDIGSLFLADGVDEHSIGAIRYTIPVDIPSDWAQTEVWKAICKGVVPFDLQGAYRDAITREEFCRLMIALVEQATGKDINSYAASKGLAIAAPFVDTNTPEVLAAYALGIVNGTSATTFNPSGSITRQEAATMLARTAKVLGLTAGGSQSFADAGSFSSWAKEGITFVSGLTDPTTGGKVMNGTGNNCFSPLAPYTREQAAITALRLLHCAV